MQSVRTVGNRYGNQGWQLCLLHTECDSSNLPTHPALLR